MISIAQLDFGTGTRGTLGSPPPRTFQDENLLLVESEKHNKKRLKGLKFERVWLSTDREGNRESKAAPGAKARPPADKQIGTSYSNRVCYNLLQWQQKTDLAGNGAKRNEKQREMKTAAPEQYTLEHQNPNSSTAALSDSKVKGKGSQDGLCKKQDHLKMRTDKQSIKTHHATGQHGQARAPLLASDKTELRSKRICRGVRHNEEQRGSDTRKTQQT